MALTKIPSSLLDTSGGFDLQGNITLGDNEQIQLGDSTDLAIYHDGSHSYIKDTGTGNLFIDATGLRLRTGAGTENYLVAEGNGAVTLYYDNDAKIATSSTGATVTGNLAVTGDLDITGNVNSYNVTDLDVTDQTITLGAGQTEANSGGSGIIIDGSSASILWDETNDEFVINKNVKHGAIQLSEDTTSYSLDATLSYYSASNGVYLNGPGTNGWLRLNASGVSNARTHIDLYGQNQGDYIKMRAGNADALWINSAGNTGLGESSPQRRLHIGGTAPGDSIIRQDATSSGTNWEIGERVAGKYQFWEDDGDNVRLTIMSTGNVGIGTSNPSEKLHVEGSVVIDAFNMGDEEGIFFREGFSSSNKYNVSIMAKDHNGASADGLSINGYDGISFCTGSNSRNEVVRITGGSSGVGKILIGDTASHTDDLLQIETPAAGGGHGIQIRRNDSNNDQGIGRIMFGNNTDTDLASIFVKTDGSTDNAAMTFNTQPNGGALTERMRVTSGGDVSIGSDHSGFSGWRVLNLRGEAGAGALINWESNNATRKAAIAQSSSNLRLQVFDTGSITFEPGTGTEYMRLDASGHLILGSNISTTEAGKFNVYTDATNDPAIYGYRSTSSFKIVPFLSNGAFSSLSNVNDSGLFFSDNFVIAKHATGYYGAVFHGNGSIFIGTESEATGSTGGATFSADSNNRRNLICATTSTSNLELIEFRNPNGTVGTIKSNGTSTSYNTSSDYRLKENVTYEFNALDRVTQLKPARFNFITDADTVLDGFLAHEVSDIVPEAVSGEKDETKEKEVEVTPAQYEDDGETLISEAVMETRTVPVYQGIDQSKLVPLLTKAIQELKTELDAAKARITELEG